jgi:hypothetical protein
MELIDKIFLNKNNEEKQESIDYILNIIEEEYKNYKNLETLKIQLQDMYIKEYKHLVKYKSYFGLENATEDEIIKEVFNRMKETWNKIINNYKAKR